MRRNLKYMVLVAILLCYIITGCYDAMEIDDEVYALTIGADKGVNNKIRLTIQYPTYKSDSGGGKKAEGGGMSEGNTVTGSNIHTVEASTILEGLDMFGMDISRRVSLMHTKLLVFSEEFAKDGIGNYLAPMARFRETRRTMLVTVVRGKAEDFIKENTSNIGESLSKSIELMSSQSDNTGFFPKANFLDFYRGMLSPYEQAYTAYGGVNDFSALEVEKEGMSSPFAIDKGFKPGEVPRKGVDKREFAGTAVFNGEKMVGSLDSYETRYFLMVIGKFQRGIITIEDKYSPGQAIPVDMRAGRSPVSKAKFENGNPVIDVKLKMEADVGAIQSRINYENLSLISDLEDQIKEQLKKGIEKVIDKVQKEYKSDVFGFGHKVVNNFSTIQEWEQYGWLDHFPEAKVNVDIEVNIRRTGLMINSSPIINSKKNSNEDTNK